MASIHITSANLVDIDFSTVKISRIVWVSRMYCMKPISELPFMRKYLAYL